MARTIRSTLARTRRRPRPRRRRRRHRWRRRRRCAPSPGRWGPVSSTTRAPCRRASSWQSSTAPSADNDHFARREGASSAARHRASVDRSRWNGTMNERRSGIAFTLSCRCATAAQRLSRADQRREERLRGRQRTAVACGATRARLVQLLQILVGGDRSSRRRADHRTGSAPPASPSPSSGPGCCTCACRCGRRAAGWRIRRHAPRGSARRRLVAPRRRRDRPSASARRVPSTITRRSAQADRASSVVASSTSSASGAARGRRPRSRNTRGPGRSCVGSGTMSATPVLEVLDAADLDGRIVDVDPVVREQSRRVDDQRHGDEVPILEIARRLLHGGRRAAAQAPHQMRQRHRRDDVRGRLEQAAAVGVLDRRRERRGRRARRR